MTASGAGQDELASQRARPDHFSTYVPREVVRRLKVVATIQDVPLWSLVTAALESYLAGFERSHGRLPKLADERSRHKE
jgi:hypothetical protein